MAKEQRKYLRLSFAENSVDPAVSDMFFNSVCGGDRYLAGKLVNEFMRQKIEDKFGKGTEKFIESTRRHLNR